MAAFSPVKLDDALDSSIATLSEAATGLCVALSGGLDSTVLLVALAQAQRSRQLPDPHLPLRAIHIDHGLQTNSAAWTDSCRRLAESLSVPFETVRVQARALSGEGPEAAARTARYGALQSLLRPGEVLLTAHHADDQMETVLLQWLRGGGMRALAGMPLIARFGTEHWHARPMLQFSREEILAWAEQQHLQWEEDPSNAETRFDRNYLRHEVLPAIRRRWPAAARTISRVAGFARDGLESEAVLAGQDLADAAVGSALDLSILRDLSDARQRAVVRAWLRMLGLPLPSAQSLAALRRDVVIAADDRNPAVAWPGTVVHRYRGRLYAMRRNARPMDLGAPMDLPAATDPQSAESARSWSWPTPGLAPFPLSATSSLEMIAAEGLGLSRARLPDALRVTTRDGGEAFKPAGSAHRRPLRKWYQERDVLPWRRAELPLVYAGDALVAVADLGYCAEFAAQEGEPSWRIVWHGRGIVTETDAMRFNWREHPSTR